MLDGVEMNKPGMDLAGRLHYCKCIALLSRLNVQVAFSAHGYVAGYGTQHLGYSHSLGVRAYYWYKKIRTVLVDNV